MCGATSYPQIYCLNRSCCVTKPAWCLCLYACVWFLNLQYAEAQQKYLTALGYIESIELKSATATEQVVIDGCVQIALLLNFAACKLKLRDYPATVKYTTMVLEQEPTNVKALFRRGQVGTFYLSSLLHLFVWFSDPWITCAVRCLRCNLLQCASMCFNCFAICVHAKAPHGKQILLEFSHVERGARIYDKLAFDKYARLATIAWLT